MYCLYILDYNNVSMSQEYYLNKILKHVQFLKYAAPFPLTSIHIQRNDMENYSANLLCIAALPLWLFS
jgi:hypothetical protein